MFTLMFSLSACSLQPANVCPVAVMQTTTTADSTLNYNNYNIDIIPNGTYTTSCAAIKRNRTALSSLYVQQKVSFDSAQRYFTESLLNNILPHWYGTTWSFDGHTSTPGTGEIACGYLVSTTLNHAGVNINRYKAAQQNPYNEARTYSCGDSVYTIYSARTLVSTLLQPGHADGFYFVGLGSSHVGMLLKRMGKLFFIHSDYVDGKTLIEEAATSPVLNYYSTFYVTPLSANRNFIVKWLANQAVEIKM